MYRTEAAIKHAYTHKQDWRGAPPGWNQIHRNCVFSEKKCYYHARLERRGHRARGGVQKREEKETAEKEKEKETEVVG